MTGSAQLDYYRIGDDGSGTQPLRNLLVPIPPDQAAGLAAIARRMHIVAR